MRMTRYSRGRPDYGGGYGRGSNGRFRGGRGRFMRGGHFEYDHNYQMFRRGRSYGSYGYSSDRYDQNYRERTDARYRYHRYSSSPRRDDREEYKDKRHGSPVEHVSRSSSHEDVPTKKSGSRKRRREPHESEEARREHSSSAALSDISSGSSCFGAVEDSDAYASPDYDDLTSQLTEEEEDDQDKQKSRDEVKRKKKKKEKKKRDKERRQRKKEKKRKKELLERICPPDIDTSQSKEIFSSGKNILVSVSFPEADPEDEKPTEKSRKKSKKKKSSRKKPKSDLKIKEEHLRQSLEELIAYSASHQRKKRKVDENVKPVAIIDLERSPGKQVISSPKEVIVLSDDEATGKKKSKAAADLVGPNTPPEPAPKSPESYDPFDPTKSSTQSPISGRNLGSISTVSYPEHHHHHHHHHGHYQYQRQPNDQKLSVSQTSLDLNSAIGEQYDDGILDLHPSSPMNHLSPRTQYRQPPLKVHRPSPLKKQSGHLPASATITSGAMVAEASSGAPFGDDMDDGEISPYSPRSSDCDDHMFDPPSEGCGPFNTNGSSSHPQPKTIALTVDNLRRVFGNDKNTLYGDLRRPNEAVALVDEMYKPQKVTMEMLDDIPNSAVDLQIKEKLIQKLQRQERIVEEVKHFLKPHFNKKRINKDEYKDIMKKSIPKICHSRSGEINPLKIQNLITAYVKKAVAKRRIATSSGNAIVSSTTAVT